jgi:diguanylate cyclase (GGDEF)-like protein
MTSGYGFGQCRGLPGGDAVSVTDQPRSAKRRRRRGDRLTRPRDWKLWQVPRPFLVLVLAVDAGAVAAVVGTAVLYPVTGRHLLWFAILAGLAITHLEVTRRVERMRELASEGVPYVSLKAVWTFAGLLILPPGLVAALIVITYAHSWYRIGRSILPHRSVFSAATVVLASAAAGIVLAVSSPSTYPGVPTGWLGLAAVTAAAVLRWAVNSGFVLAALLTMNPETSWRQAWQGAFGTPGDDLIEFASLSFGALAATVLITNPPLILALSLPLMVVHRSVRFEYAAERDRETGALRMDLWHELATRQLERADRLGTPVGYLVVRLDKPDPAVAELANGNIGRRVADAIRSELRNTDLMGRLPGSLDFAVLVVDVAGYDLSRVADRIRQVVKAITFSGNGPNGQALGGLTVSIGGAGYPASASTLVELMMCADNALMLAKTYVRDEVAIVGPDSPQR